MTQPDPSLDELLEIHDYVYEGDDDE
ncbi:hypothetical protein LHTSCC_56 [Mycobacterium phage LHTSCC]|uniref:Uncharacterized protein n=3 Tax=Backyardiganvirus TaxID=2946815 RepID=A0A2D1G8J5_9CAUD|nr:hypothetical protein LHTSCC_56 [Mycobacterium phage LHTSCC]YP_010062528.1 hypothetical protein KIY69_gp55 [Mycobacterium phage Cerulean]AXQ63148.1 hypothetical protein SEA_CHAMPAGNEPAPI_56 [Mycobacterium phage ChampagnePapi]UXE03128.1 hypothetical protein SEA_HAPPINESS_53 [Mycobacterium phage Happiness]AER49895.1 hypothetical protein LHTSCC_56 [Mycobacterium phage LHTSCC]ATN87974.1 hypothetical protein SEA_CERULEAN_55 [Mycobacterium phage Cerulean]